MSRRGIALISTLILCIVLLVMVLGMITLARQQSFLAVQHVNNLAALYVAESGLAQVANELSQDAGWTLGYTDEPTVGKRGTYTVRFNTTGLNIQPEESINNLAGDAAVDGPRGAASVPPHTAYIVVLARAWAGQRRLEAVLSRGVLMAEMAPLVSTGKIDLKGSLSVDGVRSLTDTETVEAGIHSNRSGGPGASIAWAPLGATDRAVVSGKVSTVAAGAGTIDFGPDPSRYTTAGFDPGADLRQMPGINIPATVSANSGATVPTLTPGLTTLPAGKYYLGSGCSLNGDLVLEEGAELYVEGDLDVNGAIRGQGSVFVNGESHLRGDISINASNRLALLSQGDVTMQGFDGMAYLNGMPGAPPILADVNGIVDQMVYHLDNPTDLTTGPYTPTKVFTSLLGNGEVLDNLKHHLGCPTAPAPQWSYAQGMPFNRLQDLENLLAAQPQTETRDFLLRKIDRYREFCSNPAGRRPDPVALASLQQMLDTGEPVQYGIEEFTDLYGFSVLPPSFDVNKALGIVRNQMSSISYDKLGSSYFQGLVFSRGNINTSNQVTIVGALLAQGDLNLTNGTSLTYVEDFFSGDDPITIGGSLVVRSWIDR